MSISEPTLLAQVEGKVGIITLHRPKALNALNETLIDDLLGALRSYDKDADIGAIVITGSDKAFCAGADIKEQKELDFIGAYNTDYLKNLNDGMAATHKPIIAAVNGYALGGGCELAMMCDVIYAGKDAVFAQPEVKLGTIPGAGGTQRLIRAIGKSKAMHMILTGENMTAEQAEAAGLVAKVCDAQETVAQAIQTAQMIAGLSAPVVAMAKEAVNAAEELGLKNGLHFESRLYHTSFGLADHSEGLGAFMERRPPQWMHK
ncbi:ClpP/crotonase-like domain-containing protein [Melanogaster broomeanus]|nr:ClpP/crotonase-like domain-containing protein [Melanogaster broomeanus]KAF9230205.1 ClpP/crotonase-like domain-containing protein [Melanogaster broomeanus]